MRIFVLLFMILIFSCYSYKPVKKIIDPTEENTGVLIAAYKKKGGGIYLINTDKNQATLLDSTNIIPDDLKFVNPNKIIYQGSKLIDFSSSEKIKRSLPNSLAEQYFSLSLDDDFIVVDSIDFSYFTDNQIKKNEYTLCVYDSKLEKKLFSLNIGEKKFNINSYSNIEPPQFIYYSDYVPKSYSAKNQNLFLKILDLRTQEMIVFDSIPVSIATNRNIHYFNPRYIRNEKGQKVSTLKIYPNNNDEYLCEIEIFNYVMKEKILVCQFPINKHTSDNYKHRIFNKNCFISTDNTIYKVGNNKKDVVYTNDEYIFLDFYIE